MRSRIALTRRKLPSQERSRQMCQDILDASIRVLRREGPLKLTTPRVAKAAGISVGSLYQYFPNKHALVFALHTRVIETTWTEVQAILDRPHWSARTKLRKVAQLYFRVEAADVAEMGALLRSAQPHFEDQPEHQAMQRQAFDRLTRFVREALPATTPSSRVTFGVQLIATVLESVGKSVAGQRLAGRAVNRWATACADMVADYLNLA